MRSMRSLMGIDISHPAYKLLFKRCFIPYRAQRRSTQIRYKLRFGAILFLPPAWWNCFHQIGLFRRWAANFLRFIDTSCSALSLSDRQADDCHPFRQTRDSFLLEMGVKIVLSRLEFRRRSQRYEGEIPARCLCPYRSRRSWCFRGCVPTAIRRAPLQRFVPGEHRKNQSR